MPKLKIVIDIFSGRPNPVIELTEKESRDVLAQMARLRPLERGEPSLPPGPTLGYRGLIVEQVGRPAARLPRALWDSRARRAARRVTYGSSVQIE